MSDTKDLEIDRLTSELEAKIAECDRLIDAIRNADPSHVRDLVPARDNSKDVCAHCQYVRELHRGVFESCPTTIPNSLFVGEARWRKTVFASTPKDGPKVGHCPPDDQCLACDRLGYHHEPSEPHRPWSDEFADAAVGQRLHELTKVATPKPQPVESTSGAYNPGGGMWIDDDAQQAPSGGACPGCGQFAPNCHCGKSAKPLTEEHIAFRRKFGRDEDMRWLATVDSERAKSAELREVLRALVESLPKCDVHGDPATRAFERGGRRYCDACGVGLVQCDAPDYPRAVPLRAAVALLERLK